MFDKVILPPFRFMCAGLLTLFACAFVAPAMAQTQTQTDQSGSRQIVAEEFTNGRPIKPPTASKSAATGAGRTQTANVSSGAKPRRRYKRVKTSGTTQPTSVSPNVSQSTVSAATSDKSLSTAGMGVTIWQLRASRNADQGARLLVQGDEMVPERVASDAVLRVGDSVFLSIESPREGYLYIIDRELFADGKLGDPYLIFPTTRTRGGDNRVRPGKLINIPDVNDKPNYFKLVPLPNRDDQVGEVLSVIITTEPLENFTPQSNPVQLKSEQVEKWEIQWGGNTEQYDLEGGAGQTMSVVESDAAKAGSGGRLLVQGEPPPQTVYLVEGKNTKGLLVNVQLRYRKP